MSEIKATKRHMYMRYRRGRADHVDVVVERYLRRIKYTCLDRQEHVDFVGPIVAILYARHHVPGGYKCRILEWGCAYGNMHMWVSGKQHYYLDEGELKRLRKLDGLRRKTDILETRMRASV